MFYRMQISAAVWRKLYRRNYDCANAQRESADAAHRVGRPEKHYRPSNSAVRMRTLMWNRSTTIKHADTQVGYSENQPPIVSGTCTIPLKRAIHNGFCAYWRIGDERATEWSVGPLGTVAVCSGTEEPGEQRFCRYQRLTANGTAFFRMGRHYVGTAANRDCLFQFRRILLKAHHLLHPTAASRAAVGIFRPAFPNSGGNVCCNKVAAFLRLIDTAPRFLCS